MGSTITRVSCSSMAWAIRRRSKGALWGVGKIRSTVDREFTIIGEAIAVHSRRDPALAKLITHSRLTVGFRNRSVHEYPQIDAEAVYAIAQHDTSVPAELRGIQQPPRLLDLPRQIRIGERSLHDQTHINTEQGLKVIEAIEISDRFLVALHRPKLDQWIEDALARPEVIAQGRAEHIQPCHPVPAAEGSIEFRLA
jgi:hypothetical protein